MEKTQRRVPVLYLAPWVDVGGSDKGTIDWFRFIDRDRFAASLITTQPSPDRRLPEVAAYAEEVWDLPQLMRGDDFPQFILAFIESRAIEVVHVMNSRLGFELLPVISTLAKRPRVVVQLHVEEPERWGYVRYVTTRYGNLVDAFSLSTEDLSRRLAGYDVPRAKRRVIRTGVDAQREFCPATVMPIAEFDPDRLQIVFPVRLTGQKDPLLMVEVAARLRANGVPFQIHVLGNGDLAGVVRERVMSLGLQREVLMHGESVEMARWYAACDVALLTSQFEGLPYVAYEAMAMGLPVVAPRLPGLAELVSPDTGVLVDTRDADSFAAAIAALAADPASRRRIGDAARACVMSRFSLERMAEEHALLYEELLGERHERDGSAPSWRSPKARFLKRRPGSQPLVSVIVPCFNHGRFLPDCLTSVGWQDYPHVETIVVDDGSTDPETADALDTIERQGDVLVMRMPTNRGPGAARNAAIESATTGRYVLPLDADNLLLPTAIADMVEQLGNAGERIGFIYPNLQFFGNRRDYLEAPSYNLHGLLLENFCDTASLIDREVFDQGLRYAGRPGLIHEDWEFALGLAERGIFGEPARKATVLVRKGAFTRSELVDMTSRLDDITARHADLFRAQDRIKSEWNPGVTVLSLDPVSGGGEAVSNVIACALRQTCPDFEVIVATGSEVWPTQLGHRLRRIPIVLARTRAQALAQGISIARGKYLLATYGTIPSLLADRTIIEKLLRVLEGVPNLRGVALADNGEGERSFRLLDPGEADRATFGALCWRTAGAGSLPPDTPVAVGSELETLAAVLASGRVQCRHLSRREIISRSDGRARGTTTDGGATVTLGEPRGLRPADVRIRSAPPVLPRCSRETAAMLGSAGRWTPPLTRVLCRHLHLPSGRYIYTHSHESPHDCAHPHALGAIRGLPLPGTLSILQTPDGDLCFGVPGPLDDPALLGFVEEFEFPLLDQLSIGRMPRTGQQVLVAGRSDPLAERLENLRPVGFIEPYPIHPRNAPHIQVYWGSVGLVRTVDPKLRRHRYAVGKVPPGEFAGELGALLSKGDLDGDPLWIDEEGIVFPAGALLSNGRPSVTGALGWTAAPLTWTSFSRLGPKLRASARRAYDSTRLLAMPSAYRQRPAVPAGYLLRSPSPYTVPLYGAIHPVTGDQLLSTDLSEAAELGYQSPALLGYLLAHAPVTNRLGPLRAAAPWAIRFGVSVAQR